MIRSMSFTPDFSNDQRRSASIFMPRIAHLDPVQQVAISRLNRFRIKRAIKAPGTMKSLIDSFKDEVLARRANRTEPISFAYALGTFMAGVRAFSETAGITAESIRKGYASEELKRAGDALRAVAEEFKRESATLMDDARDLIGSAFHAAERDGNIAMKRQPTFKD